MAGNKRFVYVLKNADQHPKFYVGLSSNVQARLADHNMGRCPHTTSGRPWQLHVLLGFTDEKRAIRFERYLKIRFGPRFREAALRTLNGRPFDHLPVRPRPQD